eukprot:Rmarinus@m.11586
MRLFYLLHSCNTHGLGGASKAETRIPPARARRRNDSYVPIRFLLCASLHHLERQGVSLIRRRGSPRHLCQRGCYVCCCFVVPIYSKEECAVRRKIGLGAQGMHPDA